jgi:hypothetical protein
MNKENVNEVPSYMPVLSGNGFPRTQLQLSAVRFESMVEIVLLCNLTLQSRLSNLKSTVIISQFVELCHSLRQRIWMR